MRFQDIIRFEACLNEAGVEYYTNSNEQVDLSDGVRYFLRNTDSEAVDRIVIKERIRCFEEGTPGYDSGIEGPAFMFRITGDVLNFIGACIRWAYGDVFRQAFGHENFSFKEFLNGSGHQRDIVGQIGHRKVNQFFGCILVCTLILIAVAIIRKPWVTS